MKTISFTAANVKSEWYLVDAKGLVLGRMAAKVAAILRGKHKPTFTPNQDLGDHVVVINASQVVLTAGKAEKKQYYRHSGYIGGLKATSGAKMHKENPERMVTYAIEGMLPKTKLGNGMAKKLRVCAGETHPYEAQKPKPFPNLMENA
ncbi:MAG: 50S ribosomal protein L13 [Nitrospirota bacterium]